MKAAPPLKVRRRTLGLLLAAGTIALLLGVRLAYLQLARHPHYTYLALDQRFRGIQVDARRGRLLDRQHRVLADSIAADGVYARPAEVTDPEDSARRLAQILGIDADGVLRRLRQRHGEVWIARRATPEQARAVRAAALPGVYVAMRTDRHYPLGSLAAHVLGIVGVDNQGLEGLERQYDHLLRGRPGRELQESDATGRAIPRGFRRLILPEDGYDLVLTIDRALQEIAERELARGVVESRSEYGILILVRPRTGEVMALAVHPGFHPRRYGEVPPEQRRNKALTDQFEPGSTFKIVTAAAALAERVVRPDERFSNTALIEIGGGRVRSWRAGGHGTVTFEEAVQQSVNPVFAEVGALRLGIERLHRYVKAFGFGSPLGIDFPGEAGGFVPTPGKIPHGELLQWANISFGQGVAVTPLQMVMAAAAIANDGVLMRPYLVQKVQDRRGNTVWEKQPEVLRTVLAPEVARDLSRILRSVVKDGSGSQADVPGYRVAGKTGTAQIPEGGRYTDKDMASFVAFAPADAPELAGIVMLYDVKVYPTFGGIHAAPVMGRVLDAALAYLGVPREPEEGEGAEQGTVRVPNVRNLPLHRAEAVLQAARLTPKVEGEGVYVVDQTPKPGALVAPGQEVLLSFFDVPPLWEGTVTVPSVIGLSVDEAAALLAASYLRLEMDGDGQAAAQDPAPGTEVLRGTPVRVVFQPPGKI